jgi:HAD superfamily hydrolase (TIGR01490 family)
MSKAAAFFDLDKTILAKSSSFAYARPFYAEGLIGRLDVARSAYAQFMFRLSGAGHEDMERMREYLSVLVTGWDPEQVRGIVNETLDEVIEPMVFEEAVALMREHQELGRDVIIISSSGTEIVEPIGERLGADLTLGTQVAIEDGRFTGEILFYAYGQGKADAMERLAKERGYDLAQSYAYSDSFTDLPMLAAVGNPTACNPDSALRAHAIAQGWPILDFRRPTSLRRLSALRMPGRKGLTTAAAVTAAAAGVAWYAKRRGTN